MKYRKKSKIFLTLIGMTKQKLKCAFHPTRLTATVKCNYTAYIANILR